jgi:formyltetrahydrofolate synthetase
MKSILLKVNNYITLEMAHDAGATDAVIATHWAEGGKGAVGLAQSVINICESESGINIAHYKKTNSNSYMTLIFPLKKRWNR